MRIGLIGLGRIGAFHADTLSRHDEVDELVVTDADARGGRGGREPARRHPGRRRRGAARLRGWTGW